MELNLHNRISAATRLNRLKLKVDAGQFCAQIHWCRTVYDGHCKWNYKLHSHSAHELHCALTGRCVFALEDGRTVTLAAGTFLLLPAGTKHCIVGVDHDFSKLVCGFAEEGNHLRWQKDCLRAIPYEPRIAALTNIMLEYASSDQPGNTERIQAVLGCILSELVGQATEPPASTADRAAGHLHEKDRRAEQAVQFIRDNAASCLHIDDVASHLNLSAKQLNRILQEQLGTTTADCIRAARHAHLKRLLTETDLPLAQLAEQCNFSSEYALSRFFAATEGMPPGKYRQML